MAQETAQEDKFMKIQEKSQFTLKCKNLWLMRQNRKNKKEILFI